MNKNSIRTAVLSTLIGLALAMHMAVAAERGTDQTPASDPWHELMRRDPYPYTRPIPADMPTALDGVYVKYERKAAPPIPCRRCPDYNPEGGWWTVSLRRGVFRVFHAVSGWKSLGTYTLEGDRIVIANDPVCPGLTGIYRWELSKENIVFATVADACSAGLRARNFSHLPWLPCQPPPTEAVVADRWPKPQGCP